MFLFSPSLQRTKCFQTLFSMILNHADLIKWVYFINNLLLRSHLQVSYMLQEAGHTSSRKFVLPVRAVLWRCTRSSVLFLLPTCQLFASLWTFVQGCSPWSLHTTCTAVMLLTLQNTLTSSRGLVIFIIWLLMIMIARIKKFLFVFVLNVFLGKKGNNRTQCGPSTQQRSKKTGHETCQGSVDDKNQNQTTARW